MANLKKKGVPELRSDCQELPSVCFLPSRPGSMMVLVGGCSRLTLHSITILKGASPFGTEPLGPYVKTGIFELHLESYWEPV